MKICPGSRPRLSQQQQQHPASNQQPLSNQLCRLKHLQQLPGNHYRPRTTTRPETALAGLILRAAKSRTQQVCQCSGLSSSQQQKCAWLTRPAACQSATDVGAETGKEQAVSGIATTQSKAYDVIALGNLCVDVVVAMDELPPIEEVKRPELLEELTQQAAKGDDSNWEAGAQSNFMIAAARLGLKTASTANVGDDIYGRFLTDILLAEGVECIEPLAPGSFEEAVNRTLLCFVLVDPAGKHHFCSRYDFGPWPLLPRVDVLPDRVLQMLSNTSALFVNGFIFDELPGRVVMAAVDAARRAGAATFFDPGPRCWTLLKGDRKQALSALLDASDVVLMTQEEAEAVTGEADPEAAARSIVQRPGALTQWCVIKMGPQGALIRTRNPPWTLRQSAIQVPVADTVGCGDSFAAAIVLGYIQRKQLAPLLALANAVGAVTATSTGAGRNVASAAGVRQLLSQQAEASTSGDSLNYDAWAERIAEDEVSLAQRAASIAGGHSENGSMSRRDQNGGPDIARAALQLLDQSLGAGLSEEALMR